MPTISPDGCEEKCNDPVLVSVVKKHHGWITKVCHSRTDLLTSRCVSSMTCEGEIVESW